MKGSLVLDLLFIYQLTFSDEVACVVPEICKSVCDNLSGCSNIAYPKLVLELAPTGKYKSFISCFRCCLFKTAI